LVQCLEAESDIDPELTRHGLLMLSVDDEIDALLWSESNAAWLETIDAEKIYQLEPHLRLGLSKGLWMPHVASVRNPRLLRSLRVWLDRHPGVDIIESCQVSGLKGSGAKISGLETCTHGILEADFYVLCTGAWSSEVCAHENIKVEPVKGQMLMFSATPGLVNRVVLSNGKYVIPRRDGLVVAGSTLEYCGFDRMTTNQAKDELADMAIDLFPELASCQISHHWAGLRPGTASGIPYIGHHPKYENVYINTGHFRNGLVLAPASVHVLTSIMTDEDCQIDVAPYDPRIQRH
jgi:glycine oxidase